MSILNETVLGRTGLKVRTLGFGGIPIQRVSEEETVKIVRHCYELGMNYYDTARGYTVSEERIGKTLEDVRGEVILATKSGRRTAEGIWKELEISLGNLRTDYIDVYQLHNVSNQQQWDEVRAPGGAMEAMNQALEEGKIKHISVTSHNPDLAIELVESGLFESLMIPYNYMTPKPSEKLLPLCRELNVGTIIMKPASCPSRRLTRTGLSGRVTSPSPRRKKSLSRTTSASWATSSAGHATTVSHAHRRSPSATC